MQEFGLGFSENECVCVREREMVGFERKGEIWLGRNIEDKCYKLSQKIFHVEVYMLESV